MWDWITTNVTFDRVVGIISLIASLAALLAARTAKRVVRETQEQISTVRFSDEIAKLRRSAETLRNAARKGNWDHAREQCDELLSKAAELGDKFEDADRLVRGTQHSRFSMDIRNIAATCETGMSEVDDDRIDRSKIGKNIGKQIEILSKIYGNAQKEMEVEVVRR